MHYKFYKTCRKNIEFDNIYFHIDYIQQLSAFHLKRKYFSLIKNPINRGRQIAKNKTVTLNIFSVQLTTVGTQISSRQFMFATAVGVINGKFLCPFYHESVFSPSCCLKILKIRTCVIIAFVFLFLNIL